MLCQAAYLFCKAEGPKNRERPCRVVSGRVENFSCQIFRAVSCRNFVGLFRVVSCRVVPFFVVSFFRVASCRFFDRVVLFVSCRVDFFFVSCRRVVSKTSVSCRVGRSLQG